MGGWLKGGRLKGACSGCPGGGRAKVGGGGRVIFWGGRAPGGIPGAPAGFQGNPPGGLGGPWPGGLSCPPALGRRACCILSCGGMPGRIGGPISRLLLLSVLRSGGGLAAMFGGMGGRGPIPTIGRAPANGGRGCGGPTAGRICGGKTKFCGGRTYSVLGILWSLGLGKERVGRELVRDRVVRSLGGAL